MRLLSIAVLVLGFGYAAECAADEPIPCNFSTIPFGIILVGTRDGVPEARGQFTVTVRDCANNPLPGAMVTVEFGACTDSRIASAQPFPGVSVDCLSNTVSAMTGAGGVATFRIVGGGANTAAGSPGAGYQCAGIYADGVLLGRVTVAILDQNGSGGANVVDASLALSDALRALAVGRSDINFSNAVTALDVSLLLAATLQGGSPQSANAYCH